jgi:hypothetical protein
MTESKNSCEQVAWRSPEMTASDSKARHAARRAGLIVRKSRRRESHDNLGGFMVVDPSTGFPVCGFSFDLTAAAVVEYCAE